MAARKSVLRAWRPSDDKELTPATIRQILWSVDDGSQDPAQVRRVLGHIADCLNPGKGIDPTKQLSTEVRRYFRDAILAYLLSPRKGSLEAALGLNAPTHRAESEDIQDRHHAIALAVLRARLEGKGAKASYGIVGGQHCVSSSQAEKVWRANRQAALSFECVVRRRNSAPPLFTPAEAKILKSIYGDTAF
jgi:hypothetical protein